MKSLFDNVYASLFIIVLMTALGGGLCTWLAATGRLHWELQHSRYHDRWDRMDGMQDRVYGLFHSFGIEDWRMHFAIGAGVGFVGAMVWLRRYWAKGIVT